MEYVIASCLPDYDDELTITGDYYAGRAAVMYLKNGDPGYPEEPEEFYINKVECNGTDITEKITGKEFSLLEEDCIEKINILNESDDFIDYDMECNDE